MIRPPVITIDGVETTFTPGETVLEVTKRLGVAEVPHLCWDERLDPAGSCRLCIVEVEGRRTPGASCTLRAEDGMVIRTASDKLRRMQGHLVQMVLSENPAEVSPRNADVGPTELQQLATDFGVSRDRFLGRESNRSKDDGNPLLLRDYDHCISCYRCVRICDEVEADHAITMTGRGFAKEIATPFDRGLLDSTCTLCGQCVYTCPTGALADKKMVGAAERGAPAAEQKVTRSICPYCGTGCSIDLHSKVEADGTETVIGVTPALDGPVNEGALCIKGQFGFDFVNSGDRLRKPMIRKDGELTEVEWDEALDYTAQRLRSIRDDHGPKAFYSIASGRAPGEGGYMLQKFQRAVMGSNFIDNCSRA